MGRHSDYSPEFRIDALKLAQEIGARNAAAELGLKLGTLHSWRSRSTPDARQQVEVAKSLMTPMVRTRDVVGNTSINGLPRIPVAPSRLWGERQEGVANRLGGIAEQAIATVESLLADGRVDDADKAMRTVSAAIKDAQLLSGGSTSRSELRSMSLNGSLDELREILSGKTRNTTKDITSGLVIPAETVDDLPEGDDAH